MVRSELSSTHNATIIQGCSPTCALSSTKIWIQYTTKCKPSGAPVARGHSMHVHMPFLQEVSNSFPLDTNNIHGHKVLLNNYSCRLSYRPWINLPVWDLVLAIVMYCHQICHVVQVTQDVSFLLNDHLCWQVSWIILRTYMPCQWLSHCHTLSVAMISNCITLLLECWLWLMALSPTLGFSSLAS